jgi:hypothetical protein
LTLDAATGDISGTPTAEGTSSFSVTATNTVGNATKELSISIVTATVLPVITTTSLPSGTVGAVYYHTLAASGATPIIWSVTSGNLPGGLTLDVSTGAISGMPTTEGMSFFTVTATNTAGSTLKALSISIAAAGTPFPPGVATPPTITTSYLPTGVVGNFYNATLTAAGTAPITWGIINGRLPAGLNLDRTTGTIVGTPVATGTSSFTAIAANSAGTITKDLFISISSRSGGNSSSSSDASGCNAAGIVGVGMMFLLGAFVVMKRR